MKSFPPNRSGQGVIFYGDRSKDEMLRRWLSFSISRDDYPKLTKDEQKMKPENMELFGWVGAPFATNIFEVENKLTRATEVAACLNIVVDCVYNLEENGGLEFHQKEVNKGKRYPLRSVMVHLFGSANHSSKTTPEASNG